MNSNMFANCTSTGEPTTFDLDEALATMQTYKDEAVAQAEQAVRAVFESLCQDFDEGYSLLLPANYQAVVDRLHSIPYMTDELKGRVVLDVNGILPKGQAMAINREALKPEWDLKSPLEQEGLYNGK